MSVRRKNLPLVSALALAATLVAGTAQAEDTKPRSVPLCTLEERLPLDGRLLARIRARADYDLLLRYASDNCPGLALYLADTATATIPAAVPATPGTTANLPSTASPVAQPPAGSGGTTAIGSAGGTGTSGNTDTGSGSGNTGTEGSDTGSEGTGTEGSDTGSEGTGTDTGDGATRDRNNNGYGNGGEGDEGDTETGNPSGREARNG